MCNALGTGIRTLYSDLLLYVGVHRDVLPEVIAASVLRPEHVMRPIDDDGRSWLTLNTNSQAACDKAKNEIQELGMPDEQGNVYVLPMHFTPAGFGFFTLSNMLTTHDNALFLFWGVLPLEANDMQGNPLVRVLRQPTTMFEDRQ